MNQGNFSDTTGNSSATKTDYHLLLRQAESLLSGTYRLVSCLANLSALIRGSLSGINWAGFYLSDGEELYLGPFQGNPACISIPFGKGVCGTAVSLDCTQVVPDVHQFPGHIACDTASNSEIVIPFHLDGKVIGVLDIDSPLYGRFSEEDKQGLEALVKLLEKVIPSVKFTCL